MARRKKSRKSTNKPANAPKDKIEILNDENIHEDLTNGNVETSIKNVQSLKETVKTADTNGNAEITTSHTTTTHKILENIIINETTIESKRLYSEIVTKNKDEILESNEKTDSDECSSLTEINSETHTTVIEHPSNLNSPADSAFNATKETLKEIEKVLSNLPKNATETNGDSNNLENVLEECRAAVKTASDDVVESLKFYCERTIQPLASSSPKITDINGESSNIIPGTPNCSLADNAELEGNQRSKEEASSETVVCKAEVNSVATESKPIKDDETEIKKSEIDNEQQNPIRSEVEPKADIIESTKSGEVAAKEEATTESTETPEKKKTLVSRIFTFSRNLFKRNTVKPNEELTKNALNAAAETLLVPIVCAPLIEEKSAEDMTTTLPKIDRTQLNKVSLRTSKIQMASKIKSDDLVLVLDKNAILHEVDSLIKLSEDENLQKLQQNVKYLIPYRVLEELHETVSIGESNLDYEKCRKALDLIDDMYFMENEFFIGQSPMDDNNNLITIFMPEDKVINCCYQAMNCGVTRVVLVSNNANLRNKATVSNIESYENDQISNLIEHFNKVCNGEITYDFKKYMSIDI